jgi:ferritin
MRMSDDLAAAFNEQVTLELASSVAYLQMSAHFASQNLTGMASWMRHQAEEEKEHAARFLDFILDRGNEVRIGALEAPATGFDSPADVFETALTQEQKVTRAIHDLYRLATDDGDLACYPFLQSFIEEQIEEESTVDGILERVRLAGGEPSAILLLDNELGSRGGT